MGVQGLFPLIKSITNVDFKLSQLRGANIGIDASGWLYRGSISCGQDLALGNPTEVYMHYFLGQLKAVLEAKPASIHIVFDGCSLPSKRGTHNKRKEIRENNLSKAKELHEGGDTAGAEAYFQRSVTVTFDMVESIISALQK